jgi:hypothetical protein
MNLTRWCYAGLLALIAVLAVVPASAIAKKAETVDVCKHGCDFRTIQDAVDETGKNATINVKPGTYKEGVLVSGKKHEGLTIQGTKKNAAKVVLEGKNKFNNGIEGDRVNGLNVLNMTAQNYTANGFFFHGEGSKPCDGYLMKNLVASFNRAYGLFAFNCIGGRMTESTGFGQGDSAFYVGETPAQSKPKWTKLDHLDGHENVLGYSGTNSKYVKITESDFYNNGAGVVPNTLDSERFEPNANGIIENNNIFWNNFNYFLPNSRVQTVSNGLGQLGDLTINFPTGVGIVLLGSDGWTIQNNNIFGNFKWGAAVLSDPFNCEGPASGDCPTGDDAVSKNNQFLNNQMGRNGTDTNAVDFFTDGSGSGNCYSGNTSSTFEVSSSTPQATMYPGCPAPAGAGGNGSATGDSDNFGKLAGYVTTNPPEKQECSWVKHDHPAFEGFEPLNVTPGPAC